MRRSVWRRLAWRVEGGVLETKLIISIDLQRSLSQQFSLLSETPLLDAQVLLARILGKPRAWVLAHPEAVLSSDQETLLHGYLEQLRSGKPLPYVLGEWDFFDLTLILTPQVLIPRPETELLVEEALKWLGKTRPNRLACDVGTGSGCIAISLACHVPDLRVLATDISLPALQVAAANAERFKVSDRIDFIQNDLLKGIGGHFDLICANLPYIPSEKLRSLPIYGREPSIALDGGPDGLDLIRRMINNASHNLIQGGLLLMEIEATQGKAVVELARETFTGSVPGLLTDLAGSDRLLVVEAE
jgi:release factor glutamine methyltransferase